MSFGGHLRPGWLISAIAGVVALIAIALGHVSLLLPTVAVLGLVFGLSSLVHTHRSVKAIGAASAALCVIDLVVFAGRSITRS